MIYEMNNLLFRSYLDHLMFLTMVLKNLHTETANCLNWPKITFSLQ